MKNTQTDAKRVHWVSVVRVICGVLLGLIAAWLFAGIVINILIRTFVIQWPLGLQIFAYGPRIGFSLVLLLVIILNFLALGNQFWEWIQKSIVSLFFDNNFPGYEEKKVKKSKQLIISTILIVVFYLILFLSVTLFSRWTGYTFKSDWALLVYSSIPLLVYGAILIIEMFPKITAKVGGIEIGLEKTVISSLLEAPEIAYSRLTEIQEKLRIVDLPKIRLEIIKGEKLPRILTVPLSGLVVNFIALRHYVYELSKIAPLEYIVFLDDEKRFLGFLTVKKFKERFPKYNLEFLLDDYPIYPGLSGEERIFNYWEQILCFHKGDDGGPFLNEIRMRLLLSQWLPQRKESIGEDGLLHDSLFYITYENLWFLNLNKSKVLLNAKAIKAYTIMNDEGLPGIPVVDDKNIFVGIITKESITDKIINQLLEQAVNLEK